MILYSLDQDDGYIIGAQSGKDDGWPAEKYAALEESIRKWEWVVSSLEIPGGPLPRSGWVSCALCRLYLQNHACAGCPVSEETGHPYCEQSPHEDYVHAIKLSDPKVALLHAREELAFLKSLRPQPLIPQEPGLYWVRQKQIADWEYIAEVSGEVPYLSMRIYKFPGGELVSLHPERRIFGPKVKKPDIEMKGN